MYRSYIVVSEGAIIFFPIYSHSRRSVLAGLSSIALVLPACTHSNSLLADYDVSIMKNLYLDCYRDSVLAHRCLSYTTSAHRWYAILAEVYRVRNEHKKYLMKIINNSHLPQTSQNLLENPASSSHHFEILISQLSNQLQQSHSHAYNTCIHTQGGLSALSANIAAACACLLDTLHTHNKHSPTISDHP